MVPWRTRYPFSRCRGEIEAQNKMLEALGDDIDAETARMNVVMQGVGKLLKSSNKLEIYGMMGLVRP